jgi:hypothetical protein
MCLPWHPAVGYGSRQLSMMRGSSTENRTPELRRLKSPSPASGNDSCGSEEALSIAGLVTFARGLPLPRCKPFLKTPDSFFRPIDRQLHQPGENVWLTAFSSCTVIERSASCKHICASK